MVKKGETMRKRLLKKILYVDDEKVLTSLAKEVLSQNGFNVDTARDGGEALTFILNNNIDMLITDYNMQPIGGHKLIIRLNDLGIASDMKIIVVTGTKDIPQKHRLKNVDDYIMKPFDWTWFIKKIRKLLK